MTGQSSTSFLRVTSNDNHSPQNHPKKGVTFDMMETLERNSNYIDRLTSLVSDMKMTMDRKQSPYKPKIYQGRSQNENASQQNSTPRIDPLVEEEIKVVIEGITIIETIIGQIIEIDQEADGIAIGQVIGVAITRTAIDEVI